MEPNAIAYKKIVQHFGDRILLEDGSLNREKLAEIIFVDKTARKILNGIMHPEIIKSLVIKLLHLGLLGEYY